MAPSQSLRVRPLPHRTALEACEPCWSTSSPMTEPGPLPPLPHYQMHTEAWTSHCPAWCRSQMPVKTTDHPIHLTHCGLFLRNDKQIYSDDSQSTGLPSPSTALVELHMPFTSQSLPRRKKEAREERG